MDRNPFPVRPFELKGSEEFLDYVKFNNFEMVSQALDKNIAYLYQYDYFHQTAFHWAAKLGYERMLEMFLNFSRRCNVYDKKMRDAGNDVLKLPVSTIIAYQHAAILEGNTSYIDAVNYMMDYYYRKKAAFAAESDGEFNEADFYFQTKLPIALIKWLDKIDILSDMCASIRKRLIEEQNDYFITLSKNRIYSHLIYEACCSWCFFAVDYLGTREEKENFIISMLINRQPFKD